MNAKNGELGIARFDSDDKSKRWEEHICFVTGRNKSETRFVYWDHNANGTIMSPGELPKGRVVSAAPKPGKELIFLSGEFYKLTIDDVVPATEENMAALCFSVSVDTSKVKLGGCYHTGRAYCLGYRTSHEEIELANELFTCLEGGFKGGAKTALNECKENFDHTKDIPRFIVELAAVKIIDEDCECGSHPDDCSCNDESGVIEYCLECGEDDIDCLCHEDEGDCIRCGLDYTTCGCWDDDGYCSECGEICTDCDCEDANVFCDECGLPLDQDDECNDIDACTCDSDLDDENVDQTFRPMNPFVRARWLKACSQ